MIPNLLHIAKNEVELQVGLVVADANDLIVVAVFIWVGHLIFLI